MRYFHSASFVAVNCVAVILSLRAVDRILATDHWPKTERSRETRRVAPPSACTTEQSVDVRSSSANGYDKTLSTIKLTEFVKPYRRILLKPFSACQLLPLLLIGKKPVVEQ